MSVSSPTIDVQVFPDSGLATQFAANWLMGQFERPETRNVMLAGGNTPLALYSAVAQRKANLSHLTIFALDEYVGVPLDEPRNCANLIRQKAVDAWGIPRDQYHWISSLETEAGPSIVAHEDKILAAGGIDVIVLGLGQNGHIGFNEPESECSSTGRVVPLNEVSIEANRQWFAGVHAPRLGVTTGMQTILSARKAMLLAFGTAKASAVAAMLERPPSKLCPASFLQRHPELLVVLDAAAAANLRLR